MSELILIIFLSMVFAQVWVILIQPDMVLDFLGPVIDSIKSEKIKHFIQCSTCLSGQFALWIYLFYTIVSRETYSPITHLCVIAVAIWITVLTNKIFSK